MTKNILEKIIDNRIVEIEQRKSWVPIETLKNYIIDYENSTLSNEGSFLTSNNSKFRKVENFISVVFFIILFGPLRVFFSTTYVIWVVVIYIAFFLFGLTILFPGLEKVFFG